MKTIAVAGLTLALSLPFAAPVHAGIGSRAAKEAAEFVIKKFGVNVAREGAEKLAGRIASAVAKHGDDVLKAVRKVGPKAITLADDAGENAPSVLRLLSHFGDDAARVLSRPRGLSLVGRLGDEAAVVLMKHKGIAEPLLENLGQPAVKALGKLGPQSGRRLAMMAGDDLAAIGRTPELLDVVARYGDRAMDFIWRNKGVLAGGAALATFLSDPEPFLNGTAELTRAVSEEVVQPVATAVATAVQPVTTAIATAVEPAMVAAGQAMQPAVIAVGDAAQEAVLWIGGALLVTALGIALIARAISKMGFIGKLIFRSCLRLASDQVVSSVKKK